jgi:hypothetical protein
MFHLEFPRREKEIVAKNKSKNSELLRRNKMSAEKNKNKEKTYSSSNFGSEQMDEQILQMMNMCCIGKADFPDCISKMTSMMESIKSQFQQTQKESNNKSGDNKK